MKIFAVTFFFYIKSINQLMILRRCDPHVGNHYKANCIQTIQRLLTLKLQSDERMYNNIINRGCFSFTFVAYVAVIILFVKVLTKKIKDF